MFDIGFSELLLIAVVALVVLGPERLPKAARFAGLWVRRARGQWDSVKQELERELHAEEIKRNLRDVRQSMQQAETEMRDQARGVQDQADAFRQEVERPADAERVIEPRPIAKAELPPNHAVQVDEVAAEAAPKTPAEASTPLPVEPPSPDTAPAEPERPR